MYTNHNTKNKKMNKKKILVVIAIIFIIFLLFKSFKSPKISLNGDSEITLNLNSNFTDSGATAKYGSKDISNNITVDNNGFDIGKIGSYEFKYTIKYKKKTSTVTRIVNVIDSEKPTITLNDSAEINIAQGTKYQDLGATAVDNYDGDLTTKISIENNIDTSKLGKYTVNYTVKDSSGNESEVTRTVNVVDKNSKNLSNKKAKGLPVLMYHFFYDKESGQTGKDANYMEIHDFEDQLKYLTENNYYFPTWDEVKNYIDGTSCLPEHSIVITVDDGDKTFFDLAVPVIERYNVKVTSFVVTSWIGDNIYLKQFSNKINFQSHSHDMHRAGSDGKGRFLSLSHDEALKDVQTSQSFIGNATVFCYPFGHYNDDCMKTLKEAGYVMAYTTKYGRIRPGDNPYELSRIRMSKGDSLNSFSKKVN
mgnify:FL=1